MRLPCEHAGMTATETSLPFAELTPHVVLDALSDVGLRGDGRLLQLNSYENRVFQVSLEDGTTVVAKFYRPGRWSDAQILEEHAFANELALAEIPVVAPLVLRVEAQAQDIRCLGEPPTLALRESLRFSAAPRCAGRAPELDDPDTLERIGRFIGRMHVVGARNDFAVRRPLDVQTLGWSPRDWLIEHERVTAAALPAWSATSRQALDIASERLASQGGVRRLRVHGDCHPGNLLWSSAGPHFVDLDDATTAPAVQDLWMLLSGDPLESRRQFAALLEGYEDFLEFDRRELALIEPLRTLRMVHHSAWLAQRFSDPAFAIGFPWFGTAAYWAEQTQYLQTQIELMNTPS